MGSSVTQPTVSVFFTTIGVHIFPLCGEKKARCRRGISSWHWPPRVWKSLSSCAILTRKIAGRILFRKHLVVQYAHKMKSEGLMLCVALISKRIWVRRVTDEHNRDIEAFSWLQKPSVPGNADKTPEGTGTVPSPLIAVQIARVWNADHPGICWDSCWIDGVDCPQSCSC